VDGKVREGGEEIVKFIETARFNPWWNLFIITSGSVICSLGLKGIVVHHGFIPGGIFGLGFLFYYLLPGLSAGIWYLLFSIPLFVLAFTRVGRRFFLYSLYAMVVATVSYELIHLDFGIRDQLYAAILSGVVCGFGAGIVLRSLGSNGGLDVVAVMLNQKFNLGIGKVYFIFNFLLFATSIVFIDIDLVIASLILVFVMSVVLEYTLALFSQRKIVMILSDQNDRIAATMLEDLKMGATFLKGSGAHGGGEKNIIMAITNNIMLKRLEEVVFSMDENAIFIVENTFNVIGTGFSRRRIY